MSLATEPLSSDRNVALFEFIDVRFGGFCQLGGLSTHSAHWFPLRVLNPRGCGLWERLLGMGRFFGAVGVLRLLCFNGSRLGT